MDGLILFVFLEIGILSNAKFLCVLVLLPIYASKLIRYFISAVIREEMVKCYNLKLSKTKLYIDFRFA